MRLARARRPMQQPDQRFGALADGGVGLDQVQLHEYAIHDELQKLVLLCVGAV